MGERDLGIHAERLAELGDFITALFEWGCKDPHDQAAHITRFLRSGAGLEAYQIEDEECLLQPQPH